MEKKLEKRKEIADWGLSIRISVSAQPLHLQHCDFFSFSSIETTSAAPVSSLIHFAMAESSNTGQGGFPIPITVEFTYESLLRLTSLY